MKKTFFVIAIFLTATCLLFSQTDIAKGAKLKTIKYKFVDYFVIGYVAKNQFIENQNIIFLSKNNGDTIISGKYYVSANLAHINGVWKNETANGTTRAKGIFQIKNIDDSAKFGITLNPKKGKPLQIETKDIISYQGFHNNYPAVLEKQENQNYLLTANYFDMNGYNRSWIIDKKMIDQYGWFAIEDFIYNTKNITINYHNGDVFIGETENSKAEDNMVNYKLKEGKFTHIIGDIDSKEMIKLPNNNYKCKIVYSDRKKDNNFKEMEIVVDKSLVDKYGFWAISDYIVNVSQAKYVFKNGNIYTGKVKQIKVSDNNAIQTQFTEGRLEYVTGEIFEGDLQGKWFCGIPIEGKIVFADGVIEDGNWLQKYKLTQTEANELSKEISPTEIRKKAINFYNERSYKYAITEAKTAMENKNYDLSKKWYLEAKNFVVEVENNPTKNEFINAEIRKIEKAQEDEKWKKEMIAKYGENFGMAIYNGEFIVGMTKKMANEIMGEIIFSKNTSLIGNQTIESWSLNVNDLMGTLARLSEIERKTIGICSKFGDRSDECRIASKQVLHLGETLVRYSERIQLFGGPKMPRELIFTNGKLTYIYREI